MVVRRTTIELQRCDCKGLSRIPVSGRTDLRSGALLELGDLPLEVAEVLEALVHRREPDRRDRVEGAEALEHGAADPLARDLVAPPARRLLDLTRERLDCRFVDP